MGGLSPHRWRAGIAGLLAVLLATEPVAASVSEANLWKERRRASVSQPSSFDVAGLPAQMRPLAAGLPTPSFLLSGSNSRPTSSPARSPSRPSTISEAIGSLPWSLGRVTKRAGAFTGKTVIHIQDIHLNGEAQKNIGDAVAALLPWSGAVAIEGEWGPIDLSGFRSYPSHDAVIRVADAVFKTGDLDGPLHALLTASSHVPLIGADDATLYKANVDAYRDAAREKPAAVAWHRKEARRLDSEKARVYSPPLRSLDAAVEAYHRGELPLGDYLARLQSIVGSRSRDVDGFLTAFRLERSIDLDRTAAERRLLIEDLTRRLSPALLEQLISRSLAFKAGEESAADFYSYLQSLCGGCGTDLHRYPAMAAYLTYVLAADRVDPAALQAAVIDMEARAIASTVRTPEEARVAEDSRRHRLTGQLLEFSLSPEDWSDYKTLASKRGDIDLSPFENFYRAAEARDEAMTGRLLRLLETTKTNAIVLVTGGFHANGVLNRLSRRGVQVIDWTPRITHVEAASGSHALEIFTQEKSPLQSLFEGRKLFLAPRPSRAFPRIAAALVSLALALPLPVGARMAPLVLYSRMLPGAAATSVVVKTISAAERVVTVAASGGEASVDVTDRGEAGLQINESRPAFDAAATARSGAGWLRSMIAADDGGTALGLIPWLWRPLVERANRAAVAGGRWRWLPRAVASLGGTEELFYSLVLVSGGSALLVGFGLPFAAAVGVTSAISFLLFVAPHLREIYKLQAGHLVRAPPSARDLLSVVLLGGVVRILYAALLLALAQDPTQFTVIPLLVVLVVHGGLRNVVLGGLGGRRTVAPWKAAQAMRIDPMSPALRLTVLGQVGYNGWEIPDADVAMNMLGDDNPVPSVAQNADTASARDVAAELREFHATWLTLFPHLRFVRLLGRGGEAEGILARLVPTRGTHVVGTIHPEPSQAHLRDQGADLSAVEEADEAVNVLDPKNGFAGNPDLEVIRRYLEGGDVAYLLVMTTNNRAAGQPVSIDRLRDIRALRDRIAPNVPFFLDASRVWDNAQLIKERDPRYRNASIARIVREIVQTADGVVMSLRKNAAGRGGLIAYRDESSFRHLFDPVRADVRKEIDVLLDERNIAMTAHDVAMSRVGLDMAKSDEENAYRAMLARRLWNRLRSAGVPVTAFPGGHGVFIDARRFFAGRIAPGDSGNPAVTLNALLYLEAGLLGSDFGTLGTGRNEVHLFRLALARRRWTPADVDAAADVVIDVFRNRERVQALAEPIAGDEGRNPLFTAHYQAPVLRGGPEQWPINADLSARLPTLRPLLVEPNDGDWEPLLVDRAAARGLSPQADSLSFGPLREAVRHFINNDSAAVYPSPGPVQTVLALRRWARSKKSAEAYFVVQDPDERERALLNGRAEPLHRLSTLMAQGSPVGFVIVREAGALINPAIAQARQRGIPVIFELRPGERIHKSLLAHADVIVIRDFPGLSSQIIVGNTAGAASLAGAIDVEVGHWVSPEAMDDMVEALRHPAEPPTAMMESTRLYGESLGLSFEETAIKIAPRRELKYTLWDFVLFLIVTLPTFGTVDLNYFLNKHDRLDETRKDRSSGIAYIRACSMVALGLGGIAFAGVELWLGHSISSLGLVFGPMVHISLAVLLTVPLIAYFQVRAHRSYNEWALTRPNKPTLTVDDSAARRAAEAAEVAAREGERLQHLINFNNAHPGFRQFYGELFFPEQLRPGAFIPPATGDLAEAWWDQATEWWEPIVRAAHARQGAATLTMNSAVAQFQATLIGSYLHGQTVLDIGVGAGNTILALSALGASEIHAIDSDPELVVRAQANVGTIAHRTATFNIRVDDASRLNTVDEGSINTATMFFTGAFVLPGLRARMMRRVFETLSPGGRLIMAEWIPVDGVPAGYEQTSWTEAQWRAVLEAAGFRITVGTFENNGATYYRIIAEKPESAGEAPPEPPAEDQVAEPTPPSAPVNPRSQIPYSTSDVEQFVAAVAQAHARLHDDVVPPEAMETAVAILREEAPLPPDMWQAAFQFLEFAKRDDYQGFIDKLRAAVRAVSPETETRYFDKAPASVIQRLTTSTVMNPVLVAAARYIDTLEARVVVPEHLRATRIATHGATKGDTSLKDGIAKDRNEDAGLRYIFPDGTIAMFTGDGMGGYGHGDQAAQLVAAVFMRAMIRYWKQHRGDEAALTDIQAVAEVYRQAHQEVYEVLGRLLKNTSAGAVFDVVFAHPRADGRWFFANFHRGDARTMVGEVGRPLRAADIDNDTSGAIYTLEEIEARAQDDGRFLLLRSVQSRDQLVHARFQTLYDKRSGASGLMEGHPLRADFTITYGDLPTGAFILQSTDGLLDPLTEAGIGRAVASAGSLAEVPGVLIQASQPERPEGYEAPFRDKRDDELDNLAELGPRGSLEKGPDDEEQALTEVLDSVEAALDGVLSGNNEAAEASMSRAQFLVAGIPEQNRARVATSRAFVRDAAAIVRNAQPYFVSGERLLHDGTVDLGFVVDDDHILPGHLILVSEPEDSSLLAHERDAQTDIRVADRGLIAAALGSRIDRAEPPSDYFEQRQRIGAYRALLERARRLDISIPDETTVAQVRASLVARFFPNGSETQLHLMDYLIVDNGASADSPLPGQAIVLSLRRGIFQLINHDALLVEPNPVATPTSDTARYETARERLARAAERAANPDEDVRRERLAGFIEDRGFDEIGLTHEELEEHRARQSGAAVDRLTELVAGDVIVAGQTPYLVIDTGDGVSPWEPGYRVLYDFGPDSDHRLIRVVEPEYFERNPINERRPATPELSAAATEARAQLREIIAKGGSARDDVDELSWTEVIKDIPAPTPEAPGGMIPALRRIVEPIFVAALGARAGRIVYRRLAAPFLEEGGAFTTLPLLIGWALTGAGLHPSLTIGIFFAVFVLIRAGFVALHPAGERGPPALISVLVVLISGSIAAASGFSPVGLTVALSAAVLTHAAVNTATDDSIGIDGALERAFPRQELLGLRTFTLARLPLLGLSDRQSADLVDRIRARQSSGGRRVSWSKVQRAVVSRLTGERFRVAQATAERLALAMEGGSSVRRAADRRLVSRLLRESPEKRLVLFINGRDAADVAYYSALARQSGGRIEVLTSAGPLIRDDESGRVLDMAALEAALRANDGAWDGAAFVIPADLAFDARGLGQGALLRRLVFLFLDQTLRALPATLGDLEHIDAIARAVSAQA